MVLAREVSAILQLNQGLDTSRVPRIPARPPERISGELRRRLALRLEVHRILLGYGDCGTGGEIDAVCDEYNLNDSGSHCYEFFTSGPVREAPHRESALLPNRLPSEAFRPLGLQVLGIDLHPELLDLYFSNYERVLYLAQVAEPELVAAANAADRLGSAVIEAGVRSIGRFPRNSWTKSDVACFTASE